MFFALMKWNHVNPLKPLCSAGGALRRSGRSREPRRAAPAHQPGAGGSVRRAPPAPRRAAAGRRGRWGASPGRRPGLDPGAGRPDGVCVCASLCVCVCVGVWWWILVIFCSFLYLQAATETEEWHLYVVSDKYIYIYIVLFLFLNQQKTQVSDTVKSNQVYLEQLVDLTIIKMCHIQFFLFISNFMKCDKSANGPIL